MKKRILRHSKQIVISGHSHGLIEGRHRGYWITHFRIVWEWFKFASGWVVLFGWSPRICRCPCNCCREEPVPLESHSDDVDHTEIRIKGNYILNKPIINRILDECIIQIVQFSLLSRKLSNKIRLLLLLMFIIKS